MPILLNVKRFIFNNCCKYFMQLKKYSLMSLQEISIKRYTKHIYVKNISLNVKLK